MEASSSAPVEAMNPNVAQIPTHNEQINGQGELSQPIAG